MDINPTYKYVFIFCLLYYNKQASNNPGNNIILFDDKEIYNNLHLKASAMLISCAAYLLIKLIYLNYLNLLCLMSLTLFTDPKN